MLSSRKIRIAKVATTLALALGMLLAGTGEAVAATQKPSSQARPLYWGAFIGPQLTGTAAPWDMGATEAFERNAGKGLSLIQFSAPFMNCTEEPCSYYYFPTLAMQTIREHGAIPFFNWASQSIPVPPSVDEPQFRLANIINGTYDEFIRNFAEMAKEWGHPFFLRFDWEMNGRWFPWGEGLNGNKSGEFVAAWRHVHDIFTQVGATNATWVWCPNVDFTRELTPLRGLYPGNKYVDWTCLDGFNWGKKGPKSAGWMSFTEIFKGTYKRILKIAPKKPMMIGEVASEERGGSKPAWIRDAFNVIPQKFKKVRGVIWFDEPDQGMRWPIESSGAAKRAFRESIKRHIYRPSIYSNLADGPIGPPVWGTPPQEAPPVSEPLAEASWLSPGG